MTQSVPAVAPVSEIDLCVPFASKDNAKQLGCKFNSKKRLWYTTSDNANISTLQELYTPIKCVCEYEQKDDIKKLGATWDKENKIWLVPSYRKQDINPDWIVN